MLDLASLKQNFKQIDFREKRIGVYKVLVPFFYEDGDMYDIFIEELPGTNMIRISDYALTVMKLSYTFEIDTPHKHEVLENIIMQNRAKIDNGLIYLDVLPHQIEAGINQFAQVISKVSNMDIISRELQRSVFPDMLHTFIETAFKDFQVSENYEPTKDRHLVVDYKISAPRPFFVFGVNGDTKASKVVISCLTFKNQKIPFRSLIVYENMDALNAFSRAQLTNVAQKQYFSLDGFREQGLDYIKDELSA